MSVIQILNVKNRKSKLIKCICDNCKKIYEINYKKYHANFDKLTFCSKECVNLSKKKGGKLRAQMEISFKEKYGDKNSPQSKELKKKRKQTCLEKYGVDYPAKSNIIKEKMKQTCLEKYGVDHPWKNDIILKKRKQTLFEHYGVDNPIKSKEIQEKIKQTCLEKYGVNNPNKTKQVRDKIKKTCLKKYGVDNPIKSKEIQEKSKKTCLERYGVDYPTKSKKIQQKSHETMKKNGSYGKSKSEDRYYDYLCKRFGPDNVKRQVRINDWNIDFYVKSIDTYIQFDGMYWHGLDRPIEIIKEFKNPRDKTIYETYLRDQAQNEWFKTNNLRLIRINNS